MNPIWTKRIYTKLSKHIYGVSIIILQQNCPCPRNSRGISLLTLIEHDDNLIINDNIVQFKYQAFAIMFYDTYIRDATEDVLLQYEKSIFILQQVYLEKLDFHFPGNRNNDYFKLYNLMKVWNKHNAAEYIVDKIVFGSSARRKRRAKELRRQVKYARDAKKDKQSLIERNKAGIEITPAAATTSVPIKMLVFEFKVKNTGNVPRKFHDLSFDAMNADSHGIATILNQVREPFNIMPNECISFPIQIRPVGPSCFSGILTFKFDSFAIGRYIDYLFSDTEIFKALAPAAPFVKKTRRRRNGSTAISSKPPVGKGKYVIGLGRYPLSKLPTDKVIDEIEKLECTKNGTSDFPSMLEYSKSFRHLLYLEEREQDNQLAEYDMDAASMKKQGEYLVLEVPGLAEKRPSVLKGDLVIIRVHGEEQRFDGYVYDIQLHHVYILVHKQLFHRNVNKYDVEFTLNRVTIRLLHQALASIEQFDAIKRNEMYNFLHPDATEEEAYTEMTRASWEYFNPNLNARQVEAVDNIVYRGCKRAVPFVIFGPPGTGKTVTVVETILQATRKNPTKHILVCAPSNTATDLLVERLSPYLSTDDMLRITAFGRRRADVSDKVMEYCLYAGEGFLVPESELIMDYKVIVTTCSMSGKLYNHGLPNGYFDFVFVDECGHANEPEVLASIVPLLDMTNGQLVLAGDPMQLGPVTLSDDAVKHGLGKSMLERLMEREAYQKLGDGNYDKNYVTKLVQCYRCHPSIIHIPNQLFYEQDLVCLTPPVIANEFVNWRELPNKKFPIIFHSVHGENMREENSPSWFNIVEAQVVLNYIIKIVSDKGQDYLKEIGVISPYKKQVQKIKKLLKDKHYDDVMVGSCEQFQGQERKVIIISTVRSSKDELVFDEKFDLGFVSHPKRFNVAITRAQALLIIIGNVRILELNKMWRDMIQFCVQNGGFRGSRGSDGDGDAGMVDFNEAFGRILSLCSRADSDSDSDLSHELSSDI